MKLDSNSDIFIFQFQFQFFKKHVNQTIYKKMEKILKKKDSIIFHFLSFSFLNETLEIILLFFFSLKKIQTNSRIQFSSISFFKIVTLIIFFLFLQYSPTSFSFNFGSTFFYKFRPNLLFYNFLLSFRQPFNIFLLLCIIFI